MQAESNTKRLSVVVPIYNESAGIERFNDELNKVLSATKLDYEVIYCDDGSLDNSADIIKRLSESDNHIKLLRFTTNFGKENALTAGISRASGQAVLMIDGDGQHPIELIPKFIESWKSGAKVVIGVRRSNSKAGWTKRVESKLFHLLLNNMSAQKLKHGSTDFRLIDQDVRKAFLTMPERERITRGLIDWLGFEPSYIYFSALPRVYGTPTQSRKKLFKLATLSFISLSTTPLYLFSYLGGLITTLSFLLGLLVLIEQLILGDPWHWKFTGTAMLGILLVFLVGLVLISQGIMSLYISHIHTQSKQRPLFVIDYDKSIGISRHDKTI